MVLRLVDSYIRPPRFRATIEDITDEPGSIAVIKHRSKKMFLLTWHDSSEPTKNLVCESVTPRSLPQHDSGTPCKDSVYESITPRCMPDCMLTPLTDESVILYTQLSGVRGVDIQDHVIEDVMKQLSFEETELYGEVGFSDVARSGVESSGLSHDESFRLDDLDLNLNEPEPIVAEVRTQKPIMEESSEDAGTDGYFLLDEENKIVEPDVDVHLFGISMDVPFDNIGVTNLVPNDVLEGDDVDVINADGFDSDLSNDDETSNYRRRRQKFTTVKEAKDKVYLHSIESRRNLKQYKNDNVRVRARCDGKVRVFTMSQGTGSFGLNHKMEAGLSGSSGPSTRSKKRKNTRTNDDNQSCSSILNAHDKGDLFP
ncbi:hypothetical protein Tco_1286216 [Tanacetum coccineum]